MTSFKAVLVAFGILSAVAGGSIEQAQASSSYCAAVARCGYYARDWYGNVLFVDTHTVSCESWANAFTGTLCTQEWVFNSYVRCTGVDGFGNWVNAYYSCW